MGVRNMKSPWRNKRAWLLVVMAGTLSFQVQAQSADTSDVSATGYECTQAPQVTPSTPGDWLERGLWASHCYTFQARAVAIDAVGVRTLAMSHRIQDGVRQQVVQYLDGPSVSIERHSPVGWLAWTEESENGELPSPERWTSHLEQFYTIRVEEETRVAGRDAIKLVFEPHDEWRFAHEWWLDRDTGLLLKHILNDQNDRVIETFQITQLQSPEQYAGNVHAYESGSVQQTPWQSTWLPDGFVAQPVSFTNDERYQRVYSDGLATVSIFVESVSSDDKPALQAGVRQLGVSGVAIEHYVSDGKRWQIIAIGEVPVDTLQRIVSSIRFEPLADTAQESGDPDGVAE